MAIKYLTVDETMLRLNVAKQTLANWRHQGKGPRFIKVGRDVAYPAGEVRDFDRQRFALRERTGK